MSDWGTTEKGGEATSAWEFRARYLAYGEKHDHFFCPFCEIQLVAFLIYADGDISKSPHFSARWEKHRFDCDGAPSAITPPERNPPKAHYKRRGINVPEALVGRPTPRIHVPVSLQEKAPPLTVIEVSTRRSKASSLGKPTPKTHLLQPVVEAYNITLKEIFSMASENEWSIVKRNEAIKTTLSALPLQLEDKTNYEDAFRSPIFVSWKNPRIYHGVGIIHAHKDGMFLISHTTTRKTQDRTKPFTIQIIVGTDSKHIKYHNVILNHLQTLADEKQEFRWYAYGKPVMQSDAVVLSIENLDHFYLKPAYQKQ